MAAIGSVRFPVPPRPFMTFAQRNALWDYRLIVTLTLITRSDGCQGCRPVPRWSLRLALKAAKRPDLPTWTGA